MQYSRLEGLFTIWSADFYSSDKNKNIADMTISVTCYVLHMAKSTSGVEIKVREGTYILFF
jgi:hypothetical protein